MRRLLICVVVLLSACATGSAIPSRIGMTFNELYGQVARTDCGWLEMVSAKGDILVYRVALSGPGCNRKIFFSFQDDQLVTTEQEE